MDLLGPIGVVSWNGMRDWDNAKSQMLQRRSNKFKRKAFIVAWVVWEKSNLKTKCVLPLKNFFTFQQMRGLYRPRQQILLAFWL